MQINLLNKGKLIHHLEFTLCVARFDVQINFLWLQVQQKIADFVETIVSCVADSYGIRSCFQGERSSCPISPEHSGKFDNQCCVLVFQDVLFDMF